MKRLHSILLYLYPGSFRAEYGAEMTHVFIKRRLQAANRLEVFYLWLREIVDVLLNAAFAHADILRQDLHYTMRTLARTPAFAVTAIVITGVGIGATTAAFSLADHVLLHPLPFDEPDRLVQFWQRTPAYSRVELSPPNFVDFRKGSTTFEAAAAYSSDAAIFSGSGEPQRLDGNRVTPEFFRILRVQPAFGRTFTDQDILPDSPPTVILSHAFWQSAFGGAADVLGKTIRLDGEMNTVVGIMPRDFIFPTRGGQFWRPLVVEDPRNFARDNLYLYTVARLKPGVRIEQARSELNVIAAQLERQYPKENEKLGALVEPLSDLLPAQTELLLKVLFGASACVLLIACTNLANLLVAKAMARRKELTVRAAIGAGRERLIRQLLTESVLLALLGGMFGVIVAQAGLPLLSQLVPQRLPFSDPTILNSRVLIFAAVVTLGTGLAFGILPALRMCSGVSSESLREASRASVGGHRANLRSVLIVTEIAVSVVLLMSSGLLQRALWRVRSIEPGFRSDHVLTVQTSLPMPRYGVAATRNRFYDEVLGKVRALPGVAGAGMIGALPMNFGGGIWPVAVPGYTGAQSQTSAMRIVSSGYFETMGIPLLAGRDVLDSDVAHSMPVAIVSESFARRYWPDQNVVGKTFRFDFKEFPFAEQERTIVGVVGDVKFRGLERQNEPQVYLASRQVPDQTVTIFVPREMVVRSTLDNGALVTSIRQIIQTADSEVPISSVRPLQDIVELQTAPRWLQMRLVGAFAALSVLLAGVGIYGLLSFAVGQRKPEFGLRIALGARPQDVLRMVLHEGLILTIIGTVTGLIAARSVGHSMQALLAGISASDALTIGVTAVIAILMTLTGSLVPAIRATRADPTAVIRGD